MAREGSRVAALSPDVIDDALGAVFCGLAEQAGFGLVRPLDAAELYDVLAKACTKWRDAAIADARMLDGASAADVGAALGITRQAAHRKFWPLSLVQDRPTKCPAGHLLKFCHPDHADDCAGHCVAPGCPHSLSGPHRYTV